MHNGLMNSEIELGNFGEYLLKSRVVTEKNAKQLSQPRVGADGKPLRPDPRAKTPADPAPLAEAPGEIDPAKRTVRTVGPSFLPVR